MRTHGTNYKRTVMEAMAWVVAVAVLWGVDLLTKIAERDVSGVGKDNFRLVTEQYTSGLAVLCMLVFVVYWLRLFPLRKETWLQAIVGHAMGTAFFAFGHYSLIVLFRSIAYSFSQHNYTWRPDFVSNLIVEYQKDIKIYLGAIVVISAYQIYRATRDSVAPPQIAEQKMIVQTGNGDAVVRYVDIDYLEAARNYVVVHVGEREYLLRDTITNLARELANGPFVRTHRSFIANVDKIAEIKTAGSAYRITMNDGSEVPLSRSYRDEVRKSFA